MTHPLLHLLITQPGLVAEHATGYAALFGQELGVASRAWRKRIVLSALGLCFALAATVLCGVALMLWATGLTAQAPQPWILIATPLVPAIAACGCWVAWRAQARDIGLDNIMSQLHADASLMRQALQT